MEASFAPLVVRSADAREERAAAAMGAPRESRGFHARRVKRSQVEADEIARLEERIAAEAPPSGVNPLVGYAGREAPKTFEELPLSERTRGALRDAGLTVLTAIQRAVIPHALAGRDILGAAKTGSGKTIAFLVPVRVAGSVAQGTRGRLAAK